MAKMLAIMAQASRSLLPLACRSSPALTSSSARMAARLVIADFSLLLHISLIPVVMMTRVGRADGSPASTSRRSRPAAEREGA